MHFYIDLNLLVQPADNSLVNRLIWHICNIAKLLFVKREYRIKVDERERTVSLTPINSTLNATYAEQAVTKSWMSPFGCFLQTNDYACFAHRQRFSESQFRCICRILIW